jgi:hypothetical protein
MEILDKTESNFIEKLFVCASVEHAILEFEDYESHKMFHGIGIRSAHCFCNYLDRPETLSIILRELCGQSYPYVLYIIKKSLRNYVFRDSIAEFVSRLQIAQ